MITSAIRGSTVFRGDEMSKWIEWIPEMAHGILQQLLNTAGKRSDIIWLVDPPPFGRVAATPCDMKAVEHYVEQGGVPIGWLDDKGLIHSFHLTPPFEPPNFHISVEGIGHIGYDHFMLSKEFIGDLYDDLAEGTKLRKRGVARA
jgi:hypothetical protein